MEASTSPLSIVIVGVGGADFSAMEFLDADGKALSAGGRVAQRDIVQFVPFRRFAGGPSAGAQLAAATLAEIPSQLVRHFMAKGMTPPPPLPPMPAAPVGAVPVPLPAAGATTASV